MHSPHSLVDGAGSGAALAVLGIAAAARAASSCQTTRSPGAQPTLASTETRSGPARPATLQDRREVDCSRVIMQDRAHAESLVPIRHGDDGSVQETAPGVVLVQVRAMGDEDEAASQRRDNATPHTVQGNIRHTFGHHAVYSKHTAESSNVVPVFGDTVAITYYVWPRQSGAPGELVSDEQVLAGRKVAFIVCAVPRLYEFQRNRLSPSLERALERCTVGQILVLTIPRVERPGWISTALPDDLVHTAIPRVAATGTRTPTGDEEGEEDATEPEWLVWIRLHKVEKVDTASYCTIQ